MLNEVKKIVAEQMDVAEDSLTEETTFEELEADSLDLYEMITEIEERLDITISSEDLEDVKTIGDVLEKLEQNQ